MAAPTVVAVAASADECLPWLQELMPAACIASIERMPNAWPMKCEVAKANRMRPVVRRAGRSAGYAPR